MTIKPFDFSKITVERYFDDGSSLAPDENISAINLRIMGFHPFLSRARLRGRLFMSIVTNTTKKVISPNQLKCA